MERLGVHSTLGSDNGTWRQSGNQEGTSTAHGSGKATVGLWVEGGVVFNQKGGFPLVEQRQTLACSPIPGHPPFHGQVH